MVRVVTVKELGELIHRVGLREFFLKLIDRLREDYSQWKSFQKSPRHATEVPEGIIELMPIADAKYYSFKYVNGHPNNPKHKRQTVIATGQLSLVESGYPILLSEMTLLTAFRTASTSALASHYLAKKGAKHFGIIGCGAQSEFQVLAHHFSLGVRDVYYFDIDEKAMEKFEGNLKRFPLQLHRCREGKEVVEKSDILTTATAKQGHHKVVRSEWLKEGMHLNKIGGDSPGKTELESAVLGKCKIVVELKAQTEHEGEIQQGGEVYAELWEIVTGQKKGREANEITLFDSVGFALEDYSALRLVHSLAEEHDIGLKLEMVPGPSDPKNLFGVLR